MKRFKRSIAFVLFLCMVISLLPSVQFVEAAQTVQRYELDTDRIDVGATYLIVNTGSEGSGNALRYQSSGNRSFQNQAVTVNQDDKTGGLYINTGFTNEADCQFEFSDVYSGNITHGNYSVNLSNRNYVSGNPSNTLTFAQGSNGAYQIYYTTRSLFGNRTYYLRCNNNGTNATWERSTSSANVYLYKLVDYEVSYDITYNGNGHTAGTLPDGATLDPNAQYTIEAPISDLKKDVGEDTYLFQCWNTKADGSGTEYKAGDTIVMTEDVTLYAQWYQQEKYKVELITQLDGETADIVNTENTKFYAKLKNSDTYIQLTQKSVGTYSYKVVDNGEYEIYYRVGGGDYHLYHDHSVNIYNNDGQIVCQNFSVCYNENEGSWKEGEKPVVINYHLGTAVNAYDKVPVRAGYYFLGWSANGSQTLIQPGTAVVDKIESKIELNAQWEKNIDVTINIHLDHASQDGGFDNAADKQTITFDLMRQEGDRFVLVEQFTLKADQLGNFTLTSEENKTTYQAILRDLRKGNYSLSISKSVYETTVQSTTDKEGNMVIQADLQYAPTNFDFNFDVEVKDWANVSKELRPQAVNVKVTYWGYNKDNVLGWHVITQQDGNNAPVSVVLKDDGTGTGFYPVWKYWSSENNESQQPYLYRIAVTSYVMQDGSVVPAQSEDQIIYQGGIYSGTVSVPDGKVPKYPDGSDAQTELLGAQYVESTNQDQDATPLLSIAVTPYTVTFDAGIEGTINGQEKVVLTNQYLYPDLNQYAADAKENTKRFLFWQENDQTAVNKAGQFLSGDVTYTARYNDNLTITGEIRVAATYEQDGKTVWIHGIDRADNVMVVLQKKVGENFVDVTSQLVPITYEDGVLLGEGEYTFANQINDGTQYRVQVLCLNYEVAYDNGDKDSLDPRNVIADLMTSEASVNMALSFVPDSYEQVVLVDASQIHEDLRPTKALVQILYRNLGNVHNYKVISQHDVEPKGIPVEMNTATAEGIGYDEIWNWHTDGSLYEYQMQVSKLYGNNVEGAYTKEGVDYSAASPYTIQYGPSNNYAKQVMEDGVMLKATLVPKEYQVVLDLGTDETVLGLEDYVVDDGSGKVKYAYTHTWSYADTFTAFPYREGYMFKGWVYSDLDQAVVVDEDGGTVTVGATLSKDVTLTATWEKLSGTDYVVRHLEINTERVLSGAQFGSGLAAGSSISAADVAKNIEGYVYIGAGFADGTYYEKEENPALIISQDPSKNVLTIYYMPDGSDGYTDQVESNLHISKSAVLEDDGTYTITVDMYTTDNPITTLIQQDTPLDIVLVLDQSGSLADNDYEYLNALEDAVEAFIETTAEHGRKNEVDHRIAVVGYASDVDDKATNESYPYTGQGVLNSNRPTSWINTGVFDSNGDFHHYNYKGFNYTKVTDLKTITTDGTYYTKVTEAGEDHYLVLNHYDEYRHLVTEEEARIQLLNGETILGYVYNEQGQGEFVELVRNSSGLWLYGPRRLLYSEEEFFTYHTDVWTYRNDTDARQIFGYGEGSNFTTIDSSKEVYTRTVTTQAGDQSIYRDALVPVSTGDEGAGGTNPSLLKITTLLGANGATRSSYGMEMANQIFANNPVDPEEGRVRLVVMFTDGEPGFNGFSSDNTYYQQAVTEANAAINQAYISKNTYGAYVYAIGLYDSTDVDATSDVAYYMNALSSNYPAAKKMDDIKAAVTYTQAASGTTLENNGKFFVKDGNSYYEVKYGYINRQYCWYYSKGTNRNTSITTTTYPTVSSSGKVGNYVIYQKTGGYAETENTGYYSATDSSEQLKQYFDAVLRDITTKITTEIVLHDDTILRDFMNQGLVLTEDTVITTYLQEGEYISDGNIKWKENLVKKTELALSSGATTEKDGDGTNGSSGIAINVYNYEAGNATNPAKAEYHPHTVDITGYKFSHYYIDDEHTTGYKLIAKITRVEARDDVQWGRSTNTNGETSGVWLPADEKDNRELLLPFDQPTTIFVERAYVLDYGKQFTLADWYFDDEAGGGNRTAAPIHLDLNIADGMNGFDTAAPNTQNTVNGTYGNTQYGNVNLNDGIVTYAPTTTNWGGYDQFYVFGNTWRSTVRTQDANENGNLWNKVTVIPANNIYYEDSFITTSDSTQNGIEGFTFTGAWSIEGSSGGNYELPEQKESAPYGDVHGWTDSLENDYTFTDGSAHLADGEKEAMAEFTFTGTGVDVYTRTNSDSGVVVAELSKKETVEGKETWTYMKTLIVDNLAVSGDYYSIPSVSFKNIVYGTYKVKLVAVQTNTLIDNRGQYYIDGIRIYNPLDSNTNYQEDIVKDAYGLETNAVFTEVRDVLLDYNDFNIDMEDIEKGKMGAVFIDLIQEGQESGQDKHGAGVPTYEIGTFESFGPKNEVYLNAGQAIVLKVEEGNTYYVGLKSLTGGGQKDDQGKEVAGIQVNVSGIDQAEPTIIRVGHTTDMYYQVTPVNGYIVIQNADVPENEGRILSITKLRTTNLTAPVENGGIIPVAEAEVLEQMANFSEYMLTLPEEDKNQSQGSEEGKTPSLQEQTDAILAMSSELFTSVRQWLETN